MFIAACTLGDPPGDRVHSRQNIFHLGAQSVKCVSLTIHLHMFHASCSFICQENDLIKKHSPRIAIVFHISGEELRISPSTFFITN